MWLLVLAACPVSTDEAGDDTTPMDTDTEPADSDDTDTRDTDDDTDAPADTDTDPGTDTDCDPLVLPVSDAEADLVIEGTSQGTQLTGKSLLVVDHDGDGLDDLLIGAPQWDGSGGADAGRVWMLYGPLGSGGTIDGLADAGVDPDSLNIHFGWQLADLGDLDGDGLVDIGAFAGNDGEVWIRYGSTTRMSGELPVESWDAWVLSGALSQEPLGEGVNGIGDLNADGYDDVAFANPWFDDDVGRLYVLAGRAQRLNGDVNEAQLPFVEGIEDDVICTGRCIDGEDFDGDGLDDLAFAADPDPVGTAGNRKLWLRYGDGTIPDGESAEYYPRLQDETLWGMFGNTLSFVGDLDGDGYPELAVGDELANETVPSGGMVWILRGGSTRWAGTGMLDATAWMTVEGIEADSHVGTALQGLGDVDCDGFDDLAIGAATADGDVNQAGAVALWLAPSGGAHWFVDATGLILGSTEFQSFGSSLAFGDLDASGTADLLVGAPGFSASRGSAYVFLDVF